MANPRNLRTVVYRAEKNRNGTMTLHTNDGTFNTALNSEAGRQVRAGSFPGGLPATLHIWTRGTVVKLTF